MAKALFGHIGVVPDRRLVDELTLLRHRVQTLEAEIAQLRSDESGLDLQSMDDELHEFSDVADVSAVMTEPALA